MKNSLLILIFATFTIEPLFLHAQTDSLQKRERRTSDTRFVSVSASLLPFGLLLHHDVDFTADITRRFNKDIAAISFTAGENFKLFADSYNKTYKAFDFLYGREFKISKRFRGEGFGGLGLFIRKEESYDPLTNPSHKKATTINCLDLPLKFNFIYSKRNKFGIGFQSQVNINSAYPIVSAFIILQLKL